MELDELLDRSAAPVALRTQELRHEVQAMLVEIERAARPRRRRSRAVVVAGAAAGVVVMGTTGAMAAGLIPGAAWMGSWTTGSGSACHMEFWVSDAGPDGEPLSRNYPETEKQHALAVARGFLANIDQANIDRAAAIDQWRQKERAVIAAAPAGEKQPRLKGDDLEITAVGQVVWQRLDAYLAAKHIPSELVLGSQEWRCDK
jgi:hypothetical protein